jgi:hypothetical protein
MKVLNKDLKVGQKVYIPVLKKKGVIINKKFKGSKTIRLSNGEVHEIADELIKLYKSVSWLIRLLISLFKKNEKGVK